MALCLVVSPLFSATNETKIKYPETRRVDQIDEYFGVKVPDPYRWLEADVHSSHEVAGCPPFPTHAGNAKRIP
jgi:prolyl oligopeptidase